MANLATYRNLAERLSDAFETAGYEKLRDIMTPDGIVWHSYDDREQTLAGFLDAVGETSKMIKHTAFENVRRSYFDEGFVQRHRLVEETHSGRTVGGPCCLVAEVRDGRICRVEEYLDRGVAAEIMKGWAQQLRAGSASTPRARERAVHEPDV